MKPEPEKIADASLLFGDDEPRPPQAPAGSAPILPASSGGYDLDGTEPEIPKSSPTAPPASPSAQRRKEPPAKARIRISSGVDQVWTRRDEWGVDLLILGCGITLTAALMVMNFNVDALALWLMLGFACLIGLALLAYPIFITLERPVRITPEHAVRDFFSAFSHWRPHYKRMWLLLAIDGRDSKAFRSYAEFKTHWQTKIAGWKKDSGRALPLNPFDIEVTEFKADRSTGQTEVDGHFSVRVVDRTRPEAGPVATYSFETRLVRGPDKMWYLDLSPLS